MKLDPFTYGAFWNSLNEFTAIGNDMELCTHRHCPGPNDPEDDMEWDGLALYSKCRSYRYALVRVWDRALPIFCAVMLNPSTATEMRLDPTVARVLIRSRENEGQYGAMLVLNIFAFRATEPRELYKRSTYSAIGKDNDRVLDALLPHAKMVLCGWGTHGRYLDRGAAVEARIRKLGIQPYALRVTKMGHPDHPLYLPYNLKPKEWKARAA